MISFSWKIPALAVVLAFAASSSNAADIPPADLQTYPTTVTAISATLTNAVGATNGTFRNSDSITGDDVFSFGVPQATLGPNAPQSYVSFAANPTPADIYDSPAITTVLYQGPSFFLGTLKVFNQIEKASTGGFSSLDLQTIYNINIDNRLSVNIPITFNLSYDETPNQAPCKYVSSTPCADGLIIRDVTPLTSFKFNDWTYTYNGGGTTLAVDEGQTLFFRPIAYFEGTFTFPSAVPEPATWSMMIVGFGLLGANVRRKKYRLSYC